MAFTIENYNINLNLIDDILFVKVIDTISLTIYQESFNESSLNHKPKQIYDLLIDLLEYNNIQINKTIDSLTLTIIYENKYFTINQELLLNIIPKSDDNIEFSIKNDLLDKKIDKLIDRLDINDEKLENIINTIRDELIELKNDIIAIKEQEIMLPILVMTTKRPSNMKTQKYNFPTTVFKSSKITKLKINVQDNYNLNINMIAKMSKLSHLEIICPTDIYLTPTNDDNETIENLFDFVSHLPIETIILSNMVNLVNLEGIQNITTLKKLDLIELPNLQRLSHLLIIMPYVDCQVKNPSHFLKNDSLLYGLKNVKIIH